MERCDGWVFGLRFLEIALKGELETEAEDPNLKSKISNRKSKIENRKSETKNQIAS